MKKLINLVLALMLCVMCAVPASALDYNVDAPDDYLFGRPTSMDEIYAEEEAPNSDRSKSVALIPPGFGTPTSYLPGSGEYLTPNLVPGALNGGQLSRRRRWRGLCALHVRHLSDLYADRLHRRHVRPLLLRRVSRHAENSLAGRQCQGLRGHGQRDPRQRRGALHRHQHLGWQRLCGRA